MTSFRTIVTILLFVVIQARGQSDYLEPAKGIFDIYDYQFEYYSKIRTILFKGLSDSPTIRFLVKPSFSPENVLVVEKDRNNGKYMLVYRICDKMIWHNENPEKIQLKEYRKEISSESVDDIKDLFAAVIGLTKHREDHGLIGLDGTTYYFSVYDNELRSGQTWSPKENTKLGRLVEICESLKGLAQGAKELIVLNGQIKEDVTFLRAQYK